MKIPYKCALYKLVGCLVASPIIIYVILLIAKAFRGGQSYGMSAGDSFIVWLLMAILISQCYRGCCCGYDSKKKKK